MKYISTRGKAPVLNFEEAMLTGLARDGGLYIPQSIPNFSPDDISSMSDLSYEEIAFKVISPFVGDCFSGDELVKIINKAYFEFGHLERAPLVELENNHFLLELFHGPTLAFKDFAMQLIGQFFQVALERKKSRVTIVGATSGDTGSAAIEAFRGLEAVDVFILYPDGRVSDVQRRQMTTPSENNVHAIAINGHFDDCQARLKDMFNDFEFRDGVNLAGVNSINWARIIAQIVYYFFIYYKFTDRQRPIVVSVPTGNFGDIYAGYVAKKMGLNIKELIVATNQNNILQRCIISGEYRPSKVVQSISPSMDIQVASNFERILFYLCHENSENLNKLMSDLKEKGYFKLSNKQLENLKKYFSASSCSEDETLAIIKNIYNKFNYLIDPHTATGTKPLLNDKYKKEPCFCFETAHPSKFPEAILRAINLIPQFPENFKTLQNKNENFSILDNKINEVKEFILEKI